MPDTLDTPPEAPDPPAVLSYRPKSDVAKPGVGVSGGVDAGGSIATAAAHDVKGEEADDESAWEDIGKGDWGPVETQVPTCDSCYKTEGPFKHCAKCKSAFYCNHDCQKPHWKEHKQVCSRLADDKNNQAKRNPAKPFTAIYYDNFLHDRSEKETFKILVDVLRMRQEDTYVFKGETMRGTIYNERENSEKAFRWLIRKARKVPGFLPPWWNNGMESKAVRFGLRSKHFSLECAQEKSDIQAAWGDLEMPMKLRMLGGKVYGNVPWGPRDDTMIKMQMSVENGDLQKLSIR